MIQRLIPFALLLFSVVQLQAQIPQGIQLESRLGNPLPLKSACEDQFAGTVTFGPQTHQGESNDVDRDTVFLCFNDQILIDHDEGSGDLTGDPDPSTPGGFGYAFYECPPTISGPDLATVASDPCLYPNPDPNSDVPIFVATEGIDGDVNFDNNGLLQQFFTNGEPILIWFAPITFDELITITQGGQQIPVGQYEGDPAGPCVNANVDEAFAVVYLNPIEATQIVGNTPGCGGSFQLDGGLPEFDSNEAYTSISITLEGDPSVEGSISNNGPITAGETVEFQVPQPGMYNVTVEDSKSCPHSFQVEVTSCEAVTLALPEINAAPGTDVCVDVTVENFVEIFTFQFSVNWDPSVLQFNEVTNFNPNLNQFDEADFGLNQTSAGRLAASWADFTNFQAVTFPDDTPLFSICYTVVGTFGDCSPLMFTDTPTEILITDDEDNRYGVTADDGTICASDEVLFANYDIVNEGCGNGNDGSFTLTVSGGAAPYTYAWDLVPGTGAPTPGFPPIDMPGGSSSVDNLSGGTYQVTVTDNTPGSPNMRVDTIEIGEGINLGAEFEVLARPTCFGDTDGSIRVEILEDGVVVTNPGPEYSIEWNTGATTQTITDLRSDFYEVTITKDNCSAVASTTLSSPGQLTVSQLDITDATCNGAADGSLNVEITGGTADADGNLNFQWDIPVGGDFPFSQNISGLDPGTYRVTVTDGNGCTLQDSFFVDAIKRLTLSSLEVDDVVCNGEENGEIRLSVGTDGGTEALPYVFNWTSNPPLDANSQPINAGNSSTLPNLFANDYSLVVQDDDGCQLDTVIRVSEPEMLQVTLLEKTDVTCTGGGQDGSATLEVNNGVYPYTYVWDTFPNLVDSVAMDLMAQQYDVLVTDANGCQDSITVTISAPQGPRITAIENDQLECFNDMDGQVSVTAEAGEANITSYNWSNGDTGPMTDNDLTPGVYYITVLDANSCGTVDSAIVTAPQPLVRDSVRLERPTCPGDEDGRITVFVSGDNTPFSYTISSNPNDTISGNVFAALSAGDYTITVNDANNCAPLEISATLEDAPNIEVEFTAIDSSSCFDGDDGRATANAMYSNGESGVFNFEWSSQATSTNTVTSTAIDLSGGTNFVIVTEANGECRDSFTVDIPSPAPISALASIDPVSCFGGSDGAAEVSPDGGTQPYNFFWQVDGSRTNTVSGLMAGTYDVLITDDNDCTFTQSVNIGQPDSLILAVDNAETQRSVSCNGDANGVFKVTVMGGNPLDGNAFNWSNDIASASDSIAMNLKPGSYSVTVTDIRGCMDTTSLMITEPDPITFMVEQPAPIRCNGEQTEVIVAEQPQGGQGPFAFQVDGRRENIGLGIPVFAGEYVVTVVDINGCEADTSITISEPPPVEVSLPDVLEIQLGDSIRLQPDIFSVKPLDSILWTPSTYLSNSMVENPIIRPITGGEYVLRVTDIDGCVGVGSVIIDVDRQRNVYIPNVFSPNFDGRNDEFFVNVGAGVRTINSIQIFDRWGALLFEQAEEIPANASTTVRWDGTFNGELVNDGVYIYVIDVSFEDDERLIYRGDVTVVK